MFIYFSPAMPVASHFIWRFSSRLTADLPVRREKDQHTQEKWTQIWHMTCFLWRNKKDAFSFDAAGKCLKMLKSALLSQPGSAVYSMWCYAETVVDFSREKKRAIMLFFTTEQSSTASSKCETSTSFRIKKTLCRQDLNKRARIETTTEYLFTWWWN